MVDWLPFPGLRKLRDISFVLNRSARQIYQEKKAELEEVSDDISVRKDLMTIMSEYAPRRVSYVVAT